MRAERSIMKGQAPIARIERGRFAPSPSSDLHIGSLVAAVGSWLCAKHTGGEWLLRIDDLDPGRQAPRTAVRILATLAAFRLQTDMRHRFFNLSASRPCVLQQLLGQSRQQLASPRAC